MFRHGYIFHDFLAEAGPLNDGKVRTHRCLQLIYGVNKPFRVRLQGEWRECRICLLDNGVDHFISGEDDWQICYFIYPDSPLGYLFKSAVLKDSVVSVLDQDEDPGHIRTDQPAVRPMSTDDIRGLFETFIYLFTGKRSTPRNGLAVAGRVKGALGSLQEETLGELAAALNIEQDELIDGFKRETELDLRTFLMHRRMIKFYDSLEKLDDLPGFDELETLARKAGIAGLPGLDRMFEDFFGMPYLRWLNSDSGTVIVTEKKPVFLVYN